MEFDNPYVWMSFAAALALAELFVPGVFLIWVAAAAAITGVLSFFIDMTLAGELTSFALLCIATVLLGKRWYAASNVVSDDPMLNDRAARLIGTTVTVIAPITANGGRVRVGDGEWPARGAPLDSGALATVTGVTGGVLQVAPLEAIEG
ncbi:MAG: NfeD family protein [Parasphingorhabdus sp.]|nr:NfeD family protein [Parasphingorhabdus sp.]